MEALLTAVVGAVIVVIAYIYDKLVLKPKKLRKMLEKQGIRGPQPSFYLGNIPQIQKIKSQRIIPPPPNFPYTHDWPSFQFPHLYQWHQTYGGVFFYSTGSLQLVCVTDPEIVKEITLNSSVDTGKPSYLSGDRGPLLGGGIISSGGPLWSYQRKIISPEFFPEKVKGMLKTMVESTTSMLSSWEERVNRGGGTAEITIDTDVKNLAADIISKAAFGSSYAKGEVIFEKLRLLSKIMSATTIGVPLLRYMPTKANRELRRLSKEIKAMILDVVKQRMNEKREMDFLQKILEAMSNPSGHAGIGVKIDHEKLIVDNCQSIYFAGQETTAVTLLWSMMLLAAFPEWQTRVRDEVLKNCGEGISSVDDLRNLKVLTMVIYETLRLYSPASFVVREATQDVNIKGYQISKGTVFQIAVSVVQHSKEQWGPDAGEFNPGRFANGISGACKNPQAFMPFGVGARICLGQQLSLVELKVVLALILSKFSFSLSPAYQHSPVFRLVIEPEHGIKLFLKKL